MNENELREAAVCVACDGRIGEAAPVFYRVRVRQLVLDISAIGRQIALGELIGPGEVTICLKCATNPDQSIPVARLLELATPDEVP